MPVSSSGNINFMPNGIGRHRGEAQTDAASLATYRSTSHRALIVQIAVALVVVVVMVIWLGPYGAIFAPLLGLPFGRYLRGRRLARAEANGDG